MWVAARRNHRLTRDQLLGCGAAGAALSAHFATWIPSLRLTTVALSTAMVSTQPVWSAVISRLTGRTVRAAAWAGIGLSAAGVLVLVGPAGPADARSWAGVGLAAASAVLAAAYVSAGEQVRRTVPAGTYTAVVYAMAAVPLLALCVATGSALTGFAPRDWALIAAITVVAQLGGHSLMNSVVERTSATVVSTAILFEAPGAALLAAIWLGQPVAASVWCGLAVMMLGLGIVVRAMRPNTADPAV